MARPTPRTWSHVSLFSAMNPSAPWTHPLTSAAVPSWLLVELWRSFIEIIEPSAHTPPVFEVVAPLSVPMNTSLFELIFWGGEITTSRAATARPQGGRPGVFAARAPVGRRLRLDKPPRSGLYPRLSHRMTPATPKPAQPPRRGPSPLARR